MGILLACSARCYFWLDCDGKSDRRALVEARLTTEKME